MNNIFSKFLKDRKSRTNLSIGNTNEFGGIISPSTEIAAVNEPVAFTNTVDFTDATVTGLPAGVSYKVYSALLAQDGTSAPVATVLENTLGGTVVWTRTGEGVYVATLAGAFVTDKTTIISPFVSVNSFNQPIYFEITITDNTVTINYISDISSGELNGATITTQSGIRFPIEIRVYN